MKKESKSDFFKEGFWVTIGRDLNIEDNYLQTQDLFVKSEEEFDTLLKICRQSKCCVSIVFDFREGE